MSKRIKEHSNKCLVLLFISVCSVAWSTNHSQFSVKEFHRDSNGVTFTTTAGTMRIELCGDRVVHVVASPTAEIPSPKVPVVVQPCKAQNFQVASDKNKIKLSTEELTISVDRLTSGLSFSNKNGAPLLDEPKEGGKAFDVPSVFETKTWQVQQTFSSPSDESLYGLGQHQEGIFDVRGVPIRLYQANTNISIPFLVSSKGYGILWNNAALTDFNPADQSIEIDPVTGKGKFKTGAKGVYGFLLTTHVRPDPDGLGSQQKATHAAGGRTRSDRFNQRVDPKYGKWHSEFGIEQGVRSYRAWRPGRSSPGCTASSADDHIPGRSGQGHRLLLFLRP